MKNRILDENGFPPGFDPSTLSTIKRRKSYVEIGKEYNF